MMKKISINRIDITKELIMAKIFKNKFFWMLSSGLILTFMLFVKLLPCVVVSELIKIFIDVFAMLGSGVFCSAIVALIIEKQTKETQDRQRKFILASAKDRFITLYSRELAVLSVCNSKYFLKQPLNWKERNLTLKEISDKLLLLMEQFKHSPKLMDIDKAYTLEDINIEKQKDICILEKNRILYEGLYENLLDILEEANYYLISGVLDEDIIEKISNLKWNFQDILNCSTKEYSDEELVIDFKKILFEKTPEILSIFEIGDKETFRVHYSIVGID